MLNDCADTGRSYKFCELTFQIVILRYKTKVNRVQQTAWAACQNAVDGAI
jgi:hypothetical protein